jgi:hypothetical protein
MTLQSDGKLIACGHSGSAAYSEFGGRMLAIRVNADGSLDADGRGRRIADRNGSFAR